MICAEDQVQEWDETLEKIVCVYGEEGQTEEPYEPVPEEPYEPATDEIYPEPIPTTVVDQLE